MKLLVLFGLFVCIAYAQNCISNPTTSSCKTFTLNTTQENEYINGVCSSMPWVVGCSVNAICSSRAETGYCDKFNILKDICTDVANVTECDDYDSMCNTANSVVEQCNAVTPTLPTTSSTEDYIKQLCQGKSDTTCETCQNQTDCDLLSTYSTLCLANPSLSQCADWIAMCYDVPQWPVCFNSSCFEDPTTASCSTYELPDAVAEQEVNLLCTQMSFMIGCSIDTLCKSGNVTNTAACTEDSILADICTEMPGMSDCASYNQLCTKSSTVPLCNAGIVGLPSSMDVQAYITTMCGHMNTPSCTACLDDLMSCDLLLTYTTLCQSMPDMKECSSWNKMCEDSSISSWSICTGSSNYHPSSASSIKISFALLFAFVMILLQ